MVFVSVAQKSGNENEILSKNEDTRVTFATRATWNKDLRTHKEGDGERENEIYREMEREKKKSYIAFYFYDKADK